MNRRILLLLIGFIGHQIVGVSQTTFPKNGVYDNRDGHYAFTNATLIVGPDTKIEQGTLLIKKGKIIEVGTAVSIPEDAVVIDLNGKYIYPSFVELSSNYGMPKVEPLASNSRGPRRISQKEGAYSWNEALKPEQSASMLFKVDPKSAKTMRSLGFGTTLTHQRDGMARGSSALVLLGEENEHDMIIQSESAAHYSFSKGSSKQQYPSSRMGAIALLRQTYNDGQWYTKNTDDRGYNISLERWNALQKLPQFFEVSNRLDFLRADKIGDEFGIQYIMRGAGDEYLRLDAIKASNAAVVLPLAFPKAYDVSDPFDAEKVSLTQMKHWELAPGNPAALVKANIPFALSTDILKNKTSFWKMARIAFQHGLSEADLLRALTLTPATLIKADHLIGSLEKGKIANFIITSDNILKEKTVLFQNWVKGKAHLINDWSAAELLGEYDLKINNKTYLLKIKGQASSPKMTLQLNPSDNSAEVKKLKYSYKNQNIVFSFSPDADSVEQKEMYRLSGTVAGQKWSGQATQSNGNWIQWSANKIKNIEAKENPMPTVIDDTKGTVLYHWSPYGFAKDEIPVEETVLVKNTTVWTSEKEGVLSNTDVLIKDGKIAKIGKNINPKGAKEIDGSNKHLTAGIIDEHSHICNNYGVNEGTQASSAEVRIGDVVNSEDINMYRQLAGGVTAAQLLHGSANPIGGQSALIRFRWGSLPEAMKHEGADGFIKFALGENVKQSNWGSDATTRFPQTRMGVEQVYEDHFTRAYEYGKALKADKPVRVDLELEALWEIINKKRFISCHSYVQSEITMLMRIAEKYDFRLNTFTHILEGYKIADKMKEHGAGASTFSDWWAYKYEVLDAIPYNAKILDEMGIVVAINSDDAEMGRRLNQEAAKGVKYGGMSEASALKMVTINPAKLLHMDDKIGSIKVGKQADIVLWSDHPLSIYAKAEKTFVDGICLFDKKTDELKRQQIKAERSRLIQKMLAAKIAGQATQPAIYQPKQHYHCGNTDCNKYVDFNVDLLQQR